MIYLKNQKVLRNSKTEPSAPLESLEELRLATRHLVNKPDIKHYLYYNGINYLKNSFRNPNPLEWLQIGH